MTQLSTEPHTTDTFLAHIYPLQKRDRGGSYAYPNPDRQADRQTNRQTDRQTGMQTGIKKTRANEIWVVIVF
jgi:hypothetical protein